MKQENGPSARDEDGKLGVFLSCVGNLGIPLERFILGKFLSCIRDVKDPSKVKREGGISLETLQRKWASFRVEERISWIFTSCGRKLRVPLELQRGPQGPARGASGKSCLPTSCEGPLRIPLQSLLGARYSSGVKARTSGTSQVLTWISGFLWSFHRGVRPCFVWRHASPLSSRTVTVVTCFLSS